MIVQLNRIPPTVSICLLRKVYACPLERPRAGKLIVMHALIEAAVNVCV